jgi:hypothetical protein
MSVTGSVAAAVVTWAMPLTEKPFPLYSVEVNAVPVPVWTARVREEIHISSHMISGRTDWCGFARFDFAGVADVTVVVARDFRQAEIVPRSAGIKPTVEGRTIRFRMSEPRPLTLLLDGQDAEPLHLFTHRPETDVPRPDDPNVIYFGPGEHWVDTIKVRSGQTVYLDGGAIVRGVLPAGAKGVLHPVINAVSYPGRVIDVSGVQDASIRGRGILDGTLLPHPGPNLIGLARSSRVRIEGITLRNSANWHLPIWDCEDVTVEGVCGISGRLNSDGINCVSSRRVRVRDCFMRSHDDSFAVKTMLPDRPAQDIRYERCVAWNDWGFGLGVTYETRADIRDVRFSDCDVIFARNWPIGIHAADGGTVEDVRFERVTVDYPATTIAAKMSRALVRIDNRKDEWATDAGIAKVRGITVRDIDACGENVPGGDIAGQDAAHPVEDIRFENVTINGRPLDAADPAQVRSNAHVRGVTVQGGAGR